MNTISKFTINPLSKKYSSDEMEFIDELNLSKEIWYEFPHYYSDNTITGYRAAIIKCDEVDVDYIEQIYKLKPNKIYCHKNVRHLVFYFKNSLNKYDYNRITKALGFLYKWKAINYHFYPLNGVIEEFSSGELNKSLSDTCTKLYFFQQQSIKYQKLFTISEFDKYLEVEKLKIKEVVIALYKKEPAVIPDILKLIDIRNNIHKEYWNAFSFVHHYYSSIEKAKQFFKNDFKIWFEETNSFDFTKAKEWIVIKEGENLFLSEFWYFSLDPSGNNKRLTDFYIKVHAKIVWKDWKHFFVVTLVNQWEWTETKKMIWENKTSGTTFSDFIQSYWPYHYYGWPAFIKELHRQISSTKQISTIQQVVWYWHHKSEWIIIFKNWIWDIKERLFTKKKDNDDDYYYNYDSKWYWVTDKGWNSLTEVLSTWVPNLNIEGVVEMGDILDFMSELYADNSWSYLVFLAFGMMGYLTYWDSTKPFPLVFTRWVTWCVDSETEYLTPTWWKYIKDYQEWDIIWEFNKDTWKCIFNKPLDYIKEKDNRLAYRIKTKNIDMLLTEEHRLLSQSQRDVYSTTQLWEVVSDLELHKHHKTNKYNIPVVFDIEDKIGIDLSDVELQLMVAVIANWSFPKKNVWWRWWEYISYIKIKKENKKKRLREILNKTDIFVEEKNNPEWYTTFKFDAPRKDKVFSKYYWGASKSQLKIIAEEVSYWDWSVDRKESADFVQYALLITNQSNDIEIISTQQKKKSTRIEYKDIVREQLTDWNKYCFTTNTSYWVARRKWKIFITWNSWKSTFNELLQRVWGIKKAGTDFENSTLFTMTVTLSYLIKFPYFIAEYRESANQRLQKVGTLRSVFDKISQTKGRADQSVVKYDYFATPVLDWEEMITDPALRTRSLQLQLLKKHKIQWNFSKILREWWSILDKLMFTYLSKSTWDKYQDYLDEWYDFFKKQTSQNRIAQNVASIYAWCMAFNSEKDNEDQYKMVLSEIILFQEEDVSENSNQMQIIKLISKFMESSYNWIYPLKDRVVISWNAFEEYVSRHRLKTTLKIDTYKEHLMIRDFNIEFIEVWIEWWLVEWIIIPYKLIPKNLLVHTETYKFYKDWKNLSSN